MNNPIKVEKSGMRKTSHSPQIIGRMEYLDSLRGVGAIIVALCHFSVLYGAFKMPAKIFNGTAAVSVFFVLSGYVLSLGLIGDRLAKFRMASFCVRRLCRLWIPFAAAVGIAALVQILSAPSVGSTHFLDSELIGRWLTPISPGSVWKETLNIYSPNLLAPSWTLRPEFANSLMLPFGIAIWRFAPSWFLFAIAAGVCCYLLPMGGLHFALGILIASYQKELVALGRRFGIAVIGPLLFVAAYCTDPPKLGPLGPWGIWAIASSFVLLALLSSPWLQSVAMASPLRFLGKVSFGVYLLHWPLMFCTVPFCLRIFDPVVFGNAGGWLLSAVVFLGFTVASSAGFYELIENPAIKLGKACSPSIDAAVSRASSLLHGVVFGIAEARDSESPN